MDWFFKIIRVAGSSFPVAASLVQLQSEIDAKALQDRVSKLEDPVSYLHEDVPELSRHIYHKLKLENSAKLDFDEKFYKKYSRALAALEAQGYIKGSPAIGGGAYVNGIRIIDPSYIMYLCAIEENNEKMESLIKIVDGCEIGQCLDGKKIRLICPCQSLKLFSIYMYVKAMVFVLKILAHVIIWPKPNQPINSDGKNVCDLTV